MPYTRMLIVHAHHDHQLLPQRQHDGGGHHLHLPATPLAPAAEAQARCLLLVPSVQSVHLLGKWRAQSRESVMAVDLSCEGTRLPGSSTGGPKQCPGGRRLENCQVTS
eukprot:366028-Chlamydomonas_euryale.AAC.37